MADIKLLAKKDITPIIYNCNGTNDNVILSQMSLDFFNDETLPDNASMKIMVQGFIGETPEFAFIHHDEFTVSGMMGEEDQIKYDECKSFWKFGISDYTGRKKFIIDFGGAVFSEQSVNVSALLNAESQIFDRNMLSYGKMLVFNGVTVDNVNTVVVDISAITGNTSAISFDGFSILRNVRMYTSSGFLPRYRNCNVKCYSLIGTPTAINLYHGFKSIGVYENCEAEVIGYSNSTAFSLTGNLSVLNNCKGTAVNPLAASSHVYGFSGSGTFISCTGKGTNEAQTGGAKCYGFSGDGIYISCTGTGISMGSSSSAIGAGFNGKGKYTNCAGTGIGQCNGVGFITSTGFCCTDCIGIGYTPTGANAFGFKNTGTVNTVVVCLKGCSVPRINKSGFNTTLANVTGISVGTSANIGCHISGCIINADIGTKIVSPPDTTDKAFTGNNILTAKESNPIIFGLA